MLYYTEICLSPYEVPGEQSICIYISGCCNRCKSCHYPELRLPEYGDVLSKRISDIIDLYEDVRRKKRNLYGLRNLHNKKV